MECDRQIGRDIQINTHSFDAQTICHNCQCERIETYEERKNRTQSQNNNKKLSHREPPRDFTLKIYLVDRVLNIGKSMVEENGMERTRNVMKAEAEAGGGTAIRHRQDHVSFRKTEQRARQPSFWRKPYIDQRLDCKLNKKLLL